MGENIDVNLCKINFFCIAKLHLICIDNEDNNRLFAHSQLDSKNICLFPL